MGTYGIIQKFAARFIRAIFCLILFTGFAHAGVSGQLRIGVPLYAADAPVTEDFVDRLNGFLGPDDILFVRGKPATVGLLHHVKKGKVAIIRQSVADLKKDLEFLLSQKIKVDYLCYNPEAWKSSHTPKEEKDDPVRAVINARKLADEHRLGLILVPDTAITLLAYGAEMAVHADIFVVQFQRWQRLEDVKFTKTVSRTIGWVKSGNPSVPVFAQLSTNPPLHRVKGAEKEFVPASAVELTTKTKAVEKLVDGVGCLLMAEDNGFERFFEFLEKLRPVSR